MKTCHRSHGFDRGILLLECLVYMALLVATTAVVFSMVFRFWGGTKRLQQDADDIVRTMHLGEQWRADVRAALKPVELTQNESNQTSRVTLPGGEVTYSFLHGEIRREVGGAQNQTWLSHVKTSEMRSDKRQGINVYRWELELISGKNNPHLHPLFFFEAASPRLKP
jgi:competence protein ComGF